MTHVYVVSGDRGWAEVLFMAPDTERPAWDNWAYNAVRHEDGALVSSGFLCGNELLATFLAEGGDAVFEALEERYENIEDWDARSPFDVYGMKPPGPLVSAP